MSQTNSQPKRAKYFFQSIAVLTFLMPMLPMWNGPVGIGYRIACFVVGVGAGLLTFARSYDYLAIAVLNTGTMITIDLFFSHQDLQEFYWPIMLQGYTTVTVAFIGVAWLSDRRKQKQLGYNRQLI